MGDSRRRSTGELDPPLLHPTPRRNASLVHDHHAANRSLAIQAALFQCLARGPDVPSQGVAVSPANANQHDSVGVALTLQSAHETLASGFIRDRLFNRDILASIGSVSDCAQCILDRLRSGSS